MNKSIAIRNTILYNCNCNYKEGVFEVSFSARLKRLRTECDLTQQQLAELTGINYVTLSNYETGKESDPYTSTVKKLSSHFGVSVDYLLGETEVRDNLSTEVVLSEYEMLTKDNKAIALNYIKFLRSGQDEHQKKK